MFRSTQVGLKPFLYAKRSLSFVSVHRFWLMWLCFCVFLHLFIFLSRTMKSVQDQWDMLVQKTHCKRFVGKKFLLLVGCHCDWKYHWGPVWQLFVFVALCSSLLRWLKKCLPWLESAFYSFDLLVSNQFIESPLKSLHLQPTSSFGPKSFLRVACVSVWRDTISVSRL